MWSDSMGRRKPLVIGGIILVLLGTIGLWVSPNPWWFWSFLEGLLGAGAASWVIFTVYAVSLYPEHKTTQAIGMLNNIIAAALTITNAFGGMVSDIWGQKTAFLVAAILAVAALVFILPARKHEC